MPKLDCGCAIECTVDASVAHLVGKDAIHFQLDRCAAHTHALETAKFIEELAYSSVQLPIDMEMRLEELVSKIRLHNT